MKLRKKIFILFIALVYIVGQWGCATGRYEYPKPEPLLEEYRAQLGAIGVATSPDVPVIEFDKPLHQATGFLTGIGRGASEGFENSWDWWLDLCAKPFERGYVEKRMAGPAIGGLVIPVVLVGVCYILTPPVAFFGGLGGAIVGTLPEAEPAYLPFTEALLRDTLAKYPIQENFQRSFLKEARAQTSHTFVVVPEEGSHPSEGMVGQGVDTVLELSVQRIWLKRADDREGEMNPPMVLALFVRAKLIRGPEKTVWYDQTFVNETKKHPYEDWPSYYRFQKGIAKAYQHLAEQLVEKLFLPKPTT